MASFESPERGERVMALFNEAADLPAAARAAYLDQQCGGDPDLRREVESLLAALDEHAGEVREVLGGLPLARPPGAGASLPRADPYGLVGEAVSHYRVLEHLGGGGMGVVYRARDAKLGRPVALKFLPPALTREAEAKERFMREAQAASRLNHPHICTIYEIDEDAAGRLFIAMECIAGETLKAKLKRGRLPVDEALDYAMQVAEGLSRAHARGIVHRDVKPANVLVTEEGHVKLVDFGVAKLAGATLLTEVGQTVGTVPYMSPEQVRGEEVDSRTDVWALGVVLYEMLTGERPFGGDYTEVVIYSILNEAPEPLGKQRPEVSVEVERIVERALAKDPAVRYPGVDELLDDLKKGAFSAPDKRRAFFPRWLTEGLTRRPGLSFAIGAAMMVLLGLYGYFAYFSASQEATSLEREMLAVLPFQNLGPEEEAYFADGVTEEITVRLASIDELGVIARTSVVSYKETPKTAQEIGRELGVDYILKGAVRWQGGSSAADRVRITPQLIDATDGTHLWADIYEQELADVFQVQADIAEHVVEALDITLLEPARAALRRQATDNLEAYSYFLRGNEYLNRGWEEKGLRIAVEMYERAVALDTTFTLAYAKLGQAQSVLYQYVDPTDQRQAAARTAVDRAAALNPELAEVHLALGSYYQRVLGDLERALEQFEAARRRQPSNSDLLSAIANIQRRRGEIDEAVHSLSRAVELNPRDHLILHNLGLTQLVNHDFGDAERSFDRALALAPDMPEAYLFKAALYMSWRGSLVEAQAVMREAARRIGQRELASILINWGQVAVFRFLDEDFQRTLDQLSLTPDHELTSASDSAFLYLARAERYRRLMEPGVERVYYDSARVVLERIVQNLPQDPYSHAWLGIAYAGVGRTEEAVREGQAAIDLLPVSQDEWDGSDFEWLLAEIYVLAGEEEAAVEQLETALDLPGIMSRAWLAVEEFWDPLRERRDFQALIADGL